MHSLRDRIAAATFVTGEYSLASNAEANNKIDTERLFLDDKNKALFEDVNWALGNLATQYAPDYFTYVPEGAEPFAYGIGKQLSKPIIGLKKSVTIAEKEFLPKTTYDSQRLARARRLVVVEDVTTTLGSVARVLAMPEMKDKVAGVVAIWRRGNPKNEVDLPVPIHWVVEEEVPFQMTSDEIANFIPAELKHRTEEL